MSKGAGLPRCAPALLRAGRERQRRPAVSGPHECADPAAILLGIDDPHIAQDLAVDAGKPCMLINCRDDMRLRLPSIAPDHRAIGERAAEYLFEMGHREVMNV